MEAAVGQRLAESLVEEQKKQRNLDLLGGETVGVAAAIALQQGVRLLARHQKRNHRSKVQGGSIEF